MITKRELGITSGSGSGWSNIPACYDKSDMTSATVESGQGRELSLAVDTRSLSNVQNISSATLKITSRCWYVNNNFFDVSTNVSSTVIGKVPISTTKNTQTVDITDVVKSGELSTLKLRPYASSPVYETTIELYEVAVEVIIDDSTGGTTTNKLYLGDLPADKIFLGNDVVDSIYLGDTLVYGTN